MFFYDPTFKAVPYHFILFTTCEPLIQPTPKKRIRLHFLKSVKEFVETFENITLFMGISMDGFLVLFNRLLRSIILIYFDIQIVPNLASENLLQVGLCFLTFPCHSLNTSLLSGVRCSRLIFSF